MFRSRSFLLLAGLAASLGLTAMLPRPAAAANLAVMGVRLYMSAPEVLAALYADGVKPDQVREAVRPCALHEASQCTAAISAKLGDAELEIRFADAPTGFNTGREAVLAVEYRLPRRETAATGANPFDEQTEGLPDAADGTWCMSSGGGICRPDEPRLNVRTGKGGDVTMSLTDPGFGARTASYASNDSGLNLNQGSR